MTDAPSLPAYVTKPTGSTLAELAENAWERVGHESIQIFEDQRWTGAELGARARRFASGLLRAGLHPGDRVVVCMANCPEVGVAYHGVWWAGGATTPVLFLLSEPEVAHVLRDSEAAFVVTTPEFLPKVAAAARGIDTVRAIIVVGEVGPTADRGTPLLAFADLEGGDEAPRAVQDSTDLAALLYTGGTTGRSKGVMISHDALSASSWAATNSSDKDDDLRVALLPLPLSHIYGLMVSVMGLHASVPHNSVLMRWFDPVGWLRLAQEHKARVSAVVPSMLQLLLGQPLEEYDLSAMRKISSGGAPLPAQVVADFGQRLPQIEIREGYGCTESAAIIAVPEPGVYRPGSVGVPAANVELKIERADGSTAEAGEDGEICVRGPNLMQGYWHSEEESAHALRGGWLHTGDIGHQDPDRHLYVVDRIKDLIIRDGFNVYPRDVEEAMLTHPDVALCAVVGRPDERRGEEVVAFVQLRDGATVTAGELVDYGRTRLAAVKYPRDVCIIDSIPLTSVGKLDRKELRKTV